MLDVTERKKAEAELRVSEKRFREIATNIPGVVYQFTVKKDGSYAIPYIGENCEEFLHHKARAVEADANLIFNMVPPDELQPFIDSIEESAKTLKEWRHDFRVVLPDGAERWFEGRSTPHILPSGEPLWNGVITDVTERKGAENREALLQERLSRSERLESLGTLAGGVAHDLNNTLGPLVALPDIIKEDIANPALMNVEEVQESLDMVKNAALRARNVVKDLVQIGRKGNYQLAPLDINEHHCVSGNCSDIESIREANPAVNISSDRSSESLIVSADDSHLSRAVCNIIRNAAESITDKGEVTIKTCKKSLDTALEGYETVPRGDYAVIEISDTGTGIQEDVLARIFDPFFTDKEQTDKSGSGLGLSVVHGIIRDHNGFIDVQSTVGKGTIFALYLPLADQLQAEGETSTAAAIVGGTERILIIDDERSLRFTGRKSLERLGYEAAEAENGHKALEYFERAKNTGEDSRYDLIVLDMIMEDHFNGLATYQAILKLYPKQKAILCSGFAEDGPAKAAQELGADWLAKPYKLDELALAVRKRLDRDA